MKKLIVLLCVSLNLVAFAADYYVNDNSQVNDVYTTAVGVNGAAVPGSQAQPWATLTYALTRISSGDVIYIDAGIYNDENILSSGGCIDDVTIIGAGASLTEFINSSGGAATQEIFLYIECDNWTVKDLSATNYRSDGGSKLPQAIHIRNALNVVLEGVHIYGNRGTGGDGAIGIGNNSTVIIRNSSSSCNLPNGSYSGGIFIYGSNTTVDIDQMIIGYNERSEYQGGGLEVSGGGINSTTVNISNTTFVGNVAGDGGALSVTGATVNVSNTCFRDNHSVGNSPIIGGGAIFVNDDTELNLTNCRFEDNYGDNYDHDGGAIGVTGKNVNIDIYNCYFSGNTAGSSGNGDAIYVDGNGSPLPVVNVDQSFFDSNQGSYVKIPTVGAGEGYVDR